MDNRILLTRKEFEAFTNTFAIQQKVFVHYVDMGFGTADTVGVLSLLSPPQQALCYYFMSVGMIDNSGFISILLETQGELNAGFTDCLALIGDKHTGNIFKEVTTIFEQHKEYFIRMELPPALDDESSDYDAALSEKLNELDRDFYATEEVRAAFYKSFLEKFKDELVKTK